MKVLCVYHLSEDDFSNQEPECELDEHDVFVAHGYKEAIDMITEAEALFEPFEIILSDIFLLPSADPGFHDRKVAPYGPLFAMDIASTLIRGLGLFVPKDLVMTGEDEACGTEEYHVTVISHECYGFQGERDWVRMLSLVSSKIEELDDMI